MHCIFKVNGDLSERDIALLAEISFIQMVILGLAEFQGAFDL